MQNKEVEKYDIAISYLNDDSKLALRMYVDLSLNFNVFIYSKKQEELAGTDGVVKLRAIFKERSNLIVILHRDGWGKTDWTTVEEKAIEEFGLKKHWEGILLVKLDKSSSPSWFPSTDIYLDFEIYGYDGLIGAIKHSAQKMGSIAKPVTSIDMAKIGEEKLKFDKMRNEFIYSEEGFKAALKEVAKLFDEIDRICKQIKKETKLEFDFGKIDTEYYLRGFNTIDLDIFGHEVNTLWRIKYNNSLKNSQLKIQLKDFQLPYNGETHQLEEIIYNFELTPLLGSCWKNLKSDKVISTSKLADEIVQIFIKKISNGKQ